jgi:uncharacterized membrane protein (DUF441 family)
MKIDLVMLHVKLSSVFVQCENYYEHIQNPHVKLGILLLSIGLMDPLLGKLIPKRN